MSEHHAGHHLKPLRTTAPLSDDFWVASGHHLLDRSEGGGLLLTDAFLQAYLARPELVPPPEACPVERGLHAALLAEPRRAVGADELGLMADADARENFGYFLAFRDALAAAPTLEAAYLAMVHKGMTGLPPLFVQHLTHVIARNAFDGEEDGFVLRAAECFFRPQRLSVVEGALLLADDEVIGLHEADRAHSPLLGMLGGPAISAIDVLSEASAALYKPRSDAHDFAFPLSDATYGRPALGRAMTGWIQHLTGVEIAFMPVERFEGTEFAWFLALDAEGAAFANRVWQGEGLSAEEGARVLALFTFTLPHHPRILAEKRGARGFAVLGSGVDRLVRIKPQNLIAGLPLVVES